MVFNSIPAEIREDSVVLDVNGELRDIPNDFVWIFAGGVPPNEFLKKIGVKFGNRDITIEASNEAKRAAQGQMVIAG
jgi:thioredoxin reductase